MVAWKRWKQPKSPRERDGGLLPFYPEKIAKHLKVAHGIFYDLIINLKAFIL